MERHHVISHDAMERHHVISHDAMERHHVVIMQWIMVVVVVWAAFRHFTHVFLVRSCTMQRVMVNHASRLSHDESLITMTGQFRLEDEVRA